MSDKDVELVVYPGEQIPPKKGDTFHHQADKWYFAPQGYYSTCPYSHGYDTAEAAESAALEFESRRGWV